MSKPLIEILYGEKANSNQPTNRRTDDIRIQGVSADKPAYFSMNTDELSTGLLCIGGTGSGKTNAIQTILQQLMAGMTEKDVMIIFDTKGDYREEFFDRERGDRVIGSGAGSGGRAEAWNLYREVLMDGNRFEAELNIQELCRTLFKPYESAQQPFFANAARGVFSAYLQYILRKSEEDPVYAKKSQNNREIVRFFERADMGEYEKLADSYPDLRYLRMYLGKGDSSQALGVLAELQVMIRDCFFGSFGSIGDFSIREFVRRRGGRVLFIEYDLSVGEVLSPVYSLLVDLALKEVLGMSESKGNGNVFVVLDEFKLLPYLSHMDDAVNFGRSKGIKLIAGLQAISQINDIYGEEKARSVTAGFGSMLAFRPNDAKTREFISEYFGKVMTVETIYVRQEPMPERRMGCAVEDWELRELLPGEAFVKVTGRQPYRYRFPEYKKKG